MFNQCSDDAWKALDAAEDVESSEDDNEQGEEEEEIDFLPPGGSEGVDAQSEAGTRLSLASLTADPGVRVKDEPLSELDANQGQFECHFNAI